MSVAQFAPISVARGGSRWLLLGSLALNLFFVGVAVAMAVRAPAKSWWDQDVFVRVDRLAATLPQADAAALRSLIQSNHDAIESTQANYRASQDAIRATLRAEPFEVEAMRAAMTGMRAARQSYDQTIQGVFATAAAQMSQAGRNALADWPPGHKSARKDQ
ncbi:MAG TPA: periplasmic heavy metal sensor [Pseudolabrys sp.]|nr:periplasmic heavy metal sensor [Pseudolabrys sp.]